MSSPTLVAVLGSATAPGRLHRSLSEALTRAATRHGVEAGLLDLADLELVAADGRQPQEIGGDTAAAVTAIASAEAVVLATPVYRGSMTGVLKNLLDHLPLAALEGKAVAIVAMGGSDHHFLGAERHLRDVLAFFGALVCPVAVYLAAANFHDGAPDEAAGTQLDRLLAELMALKTAAVAARAVGPHPLSAPRLD